MIKSGKYFAGDILIENGRIKEIGQIISAGCMVIDATDCFVLPGFIQCHVHTVQSLLRHQADDLELLDWLKKRTWPYEAALDGDGVEAASELGIAELLLGGTTTALDFGTTHNHDRVFKTARGMGIRLFSGKTHMDTGTDVPKQILENTEYSLREAEDLGKKWNNNGRLKYVVEPRFALSCTEILMKEAVKLARKNNWLLHTHANESINEVRRVKKLTKKSNIAYLKKVGFLGKDVILAHGVHVTDSELKTLKDTNTRICHCPGANLKLASGIADVPKYLKNKIVVALGADGPPCNNKLSIFQEMWLAATVHKIKHGPRTMDAWTVLGMATREGARALNILDQIGTLEVGKSADIAIIKRDSMSLHPDGDPASQIVYGATASDVRDVLIDGELIVRDSKLLKFKHQEIQTKAQIAWKATRARMKI